MANQKASLAQAFDAQGYVLTPASEYEGCVVIEQDGRQLLKLMENDSKAFWRLVDQCLASEDCTKVQAMKFIAVRMIQAEYQIALPLNIPTFRQVHKHHWCQQDFNL